jgi:hypothetical protein
VLHDDRERPVRCGVQAGRAIADRVAIDRIVDQVEVRSVVHRHRPERPAGWWGGESQRIAAVAVERLTVAVDVDHRVRGFVAVITPQPAPRGPGAQQVSLRSVRELPPGVVERSDLEDGLAAGQERLRSTSCTSKTSGKP